MKITADCIDRNAQLIIAEMVGCPYEYAEGNDDADHQRLVTLGYVRGVLDMAAALKEVLKA